MYYYYILLNVDLPRDEMRLPQSSAVCQARKKKPKNRTMMASTAWSVSLAYTAPT